MKPKQKIKHTHTHTHTQSENRGRWRQPCQTPKALPCRTSLRYLWCPSISIPFLVSHATWVSAATILSCSCSLIFYIGFRATGQIDLFPCYPLALPMRSRDWISLTQMTNGRNTANRSLPNTEPVVIDFFSYFGKKKTDPTYRHERFFVDGWHFRRGSGQRVRFSDVDVIDPSPGAHRTKRKTEKADSFCCWSATKKKDSSLFFNYFSFFFWFFSFRFANSDDDGPPLRSTLTVPRP